MEISSGLNLNGKKFIINNDTYDEPIIVVDFLVTLPEHLKLAIGEAALEHLMNFDWEMKDKEW